MPLAEWSVTWWFIISTIILQNNHWGDKIALLMFDKLSIASIDDQFKLVDI